MKTEFPAEIHAILEYLSTTDRNYAIFAGFAAHLLTGVPTSLDVDVFLKSETDCRAVADDFASNGWKRAKAVESSDRSHVNLMLRKADTELDLIFSRHAAENYLSYTTTVSFSGRTVTTLSPEAMLLVKLNQLTKTDRPVEKMIRDRETINLLRAKVDVDALRTLAGSLSAHYWREGRI